MKRLMTIMVCALFAFGMAMAQYNKTIHGLVVDKNGNPLVGAEVMAPGGGATAITDADGSFSMEVPILLKKLSASYAGMENKTMKVGNSSEMIFRMNPEKRHPGFISINVGLGILDDPDPYFSIGGSIMGGMLGKWGWYTKMAIFSDFDTGGGCLTAGAIKQLGKTSAHLYFGAGAGVYYYDFIPTVDLGVIFKATRHLNVITGLMYNRFIGDNRWYNNNISLNLGVGYIF